MSYDIEKKLHTVQTQSLTEAEKNSVWFSIVSKQKDTQKVLLISFFSKKYMLATLLALVVILGGGGVVVASDNAIPGDILYPVDQAVENIQIKLASDEDKKSELKIRFAEERLSEFGEVIEENSKSATDLSTASVLEVEIDVFTNETTVVIEADDKKYGFVTQSKEKDQIIAEIQEKYNLSIEQINANLSFETENRVSRADDKKFLNSANQIGFKSEKQKQEFEGSLSSVSDFVASSNLTQEEKDRLNTTLTSIMAILAVNPNLEIEMRTEDGVKIEVEDGEIEIKTKGTKVEDSDDNDDDSSDDHGNDIQESDDEVFCRGEWRDAEDCSVDSDDDSNDDNDSDDNDDDNDHSNSGEGKGDDDNENDDSYSDDEDEDDNNNNNDSDNNDDDSNDDEDDD